MATRVVASVICVSMQIMGKNVTSSEGPPTAGRRRTRDRRRLGLGDGRARDPGADRRPVPHRYRGARRPRAPRRLVPRGLPRRAVRGPRPAALRAGAVEHLGVDRRDAARVPRRALEQARPRRVGHGVRRDRGPARRIADRRRQPGPASSTARARCSSGPGSATPSRRPPTSRSTPTWSIDTGRPTRPTPRSPGTTPTSPSRGRSPTSDCPCRRRTGRTRRSARTGRRTRPRGTARATHRARAASSAS